MEQVNKVAKLNENPMETEEQVKIDDGGGDERNDNELSYMDKLPNEILMKILDYLDERKLVKCRRLSSRWNEICCLLLQEKTKDKPLSKLVVHLRKPYGKHLNRLEVITGVEQESFDAFLRSFVPSESEKSSNYRRPFPFSRFDVQCLNYMSKFQMTLLVPLLVHLKSVFLDIKQIDAKNFERLFRLLLKFAPNIEYLGIKDNKSLQVVDLFDPYFNTSNFFEKTEDKTFLENLKVVEISSKEFDKISGFIRNLVEHTPNVQELKCKGPLNSNENKLCCSSLYLLTLRQKQQRAHLVKKLNIRLLSQSNLLPAHLMKNVQLENLSADCSLTSDSVPNEKCNVNYIFHAVKSSQNTLSTLDMYNLANNSMKFCFKDISSLPNVRQLKIQIKESVPLESGKILNRFSQLCPNTTSLLLHGLNYDFSQVAPILWTTFKGLKSLEIKFDMANGKNNSLTLDSAITGYSQESIQTIQTKLENGISLADARRGEEQNPSILDLKGLSLLELEFFMGIRTEAMLALENQLRKSVFKKILPQHIRENPRSVLFRTNCKYPNPYRGGLNAMGKINPLHNI